MIKINFSKSSYYQSKPIVIDGFSGSGKILISELLKAIRPTEITKLNLNFDYLPILYSLGSIDKQAAISTLRTSFDQITYDLVIGREINLRRKDLLFSLSHPNKFNYIRNMISKPLDDNKIEKNIAPNLNIPLIVHMSSFNNLLLEETFNEKLKLFYTLRDPIYIIETYSSYLDRIQNDPREFTPKINYLKKDLPWFAYGWEEEYTSINNTEKSILLLWECLNFLLEKLDKNFDPKIHKLIFFEDLVIDTNKVFFEIKDFLNLDYSNKIFKKIKIKNKVPRKSQGIVEGFWKRYTTNNLKRDGDEEDIILERLESLVNKNSFSKLLKLRSKYYEFKEKFQSNYYLND